MIALVTGAYKGLGLAFCELLAHQGYEVILTARSLEKATQALSEKNLTTIYPKALEVTNEQQLQELATWVEQKWGKIDLIINNAGINPKDNSDKSKMAQAFYLDQLDANALCEVITTNSIAPLLVVKHFRNLLKKSQNPQVINISSWLASVNNLSFGGHYGYVGSKNLLNVFNKSMSYELLSDNIVTVNVNPGWVQTDMGGKKGTFTREQAAQNIWQNIITQIDIKNTGKFLNYDGKEHPW